MGLDNYIKQIRQDNAIKQLEIYKNNIMKYNYNSNVIKNMLLASMIHDNNYKTCCYVMLDTWLKNNNIKYRGQ